MAASGSFLGGVLVEKLTTDIVVVARWNDDIDDGGTLTAAHRMET